MLLAHLVLGFVFQAMSTVTLAWDPVPSPAPCTITGYNLFRSTTSGQYGAPINSALITSTTYTDSMAPTGVTLFYVVRADCANNESGNSNEVSITPGKSITNLGVTCIAGIENYVGWDAYPNATGYTVTYLDTSSTPSTVQTTMPSFAFPAVTGHTYKLTVSATVNGSTAGATSITWMCLSIVAPVFKSIQFQ